MGVAEVLVAALPLSSSERTVWEFFKRTNPISIRLGWNKENNCCKGYACKGYAFLTFSSMEAAESCRQEFDGQRMGSSKLVVTMSDDVTDELVPMTVDKLKTASHGKSTDSEAQGTCGDLLGAGDNDDTMENHEYASLMDSFNDDGSTGEMPTNYEVMTYDPQDYSRQRTELLTRQVCCSPSRRPSSSTSCSRVHDENMKKLT